MDIITRSRKLDSVLLSNFFDTNRLKPLPSFLYSVYLRRDFFFSLFNEKKYKLSRKFFIFFSSFSLMYKRALDTSGVHHASMFPLFTYKLFHSNWLRPLFFGSSHSAGKSLVFHKLGNSVALHKYSVGIVASTRKHLNFFITHRDKPFFYKYVSSFFRDRFVRRETHRHRNLYNHFFFFLHLGTLTESTILHNLYRRHIKIRRLRFKR